MLLVCLVTPTAQAQTSGELLEAKLVHDTAMVTEIALAYSGPVQAKHNAFANKLVIYLKDCVWRTAPGKLETKGQLSGSIQWAFHADAKHVTVVLKPFDKKRQGFSLVNDEKAKTVTIQVFALAEPSANPAPTPKAKPPARPGPKHLPTPRPTPAATAKPGPKPTPTPVKPEPSPSPTAGPTAEPMPEPEFTGEHGPVPESIQTVMHEYSWRKGCPVDLDDLAYVKVSHWDMQGNVQLGALVVNKEIAQEVVDIFRDLFNARFPLDKVRLVDEYYGSDDASMADNNSSAFNCRAVTGQEDKYSVHSQGLAVDINPLFNPYVKKGLVLPPGGEEYTDRENLRPGMIVRGDACWQAFTSRGWIWGGDWTSLKDYQHFEKKQ